MPVGETAASKTPGHLVASKAARGQRGWPPAPLGNSELDVSGGFVFGAGSFAARHLHRLTEDGQRGML